MLSLLLSLLLLLSANVEVSKAEVKTVSSFGAQPNNPGFDSAAALEDAASFANSNPGTTIVFDAPSGSKYYISHAIHFNNAINLTVDGGGNSIISTNLKGFFYFSNCKSATFQNFTIDMDPLPTVGGVVKGIDSSTFTWFDLYVYEPWEVSKTIGRPAHAYIDYDIDAGHFGKRLDVYQTSYNAVNITLSPASYGAPYDGKTIRIPMAYKNANLLPRLGDAIVVRIAVYENAGFLFGGSRDIVMQDVTIYNAGGIAIFGGTTTNILLQRVNILKRPDGLWMSATADGSHFSNCRGLIQIRDSTFEGMGDDGTNIHTHNMYVSALPGGSAARLCTFQQGDVNTPKAPDTLYPGDVLQFGHQDTPFVGYAEGVVVSASSVVSPYLDVTFEGGLPAGIVVGDVVAQTTMATAVLRNFVVRDNRARGILIKNRGTLIENCQFIDNSGECIQITTDCGYWWEGSPTKDITVRNSILQGCNYGAGKTTAALMIFVESAYPGHPTAQPAGTHTNIVIEGNTIAGFPEGGGIYVGSAYNVSIKDNYVATTDDTPIIYCNSQFVDVDNNLFSPSVNFSRYDTTTSGCSLGLSSAIVEGVNSGCEGLYAEYYTNTDLTGEPTAVMRNPVVNFQWNWHDPATGVSAYGPWSASWTGVVTIGNYNVTSVSVTATDGFRLMIDGDWVIDSWLDQSETTQTAQVNLAANSTHVVRAEYFHGNHEAMISVSWSPLTGDLPVFSNAHCSLALVNENFANSASELTAAWMNWIGAAQ